MLVLSFSAAIAGIDAHVVRVETDSATGVPQLLHRRPARPRAQSARLGSSPRFNPIPAQPYTPYAPDDNARRRFRVSGSTDTGSARFHRVDAHTVLDKRMNEHDTIDMLHAVLKGRSNYAADAGLIRNVSCPLPLGARFVQARPYCAV
jgi:hypothetical protein